MTGSRQSDGNPTLSHFEPETLTMKTTPTIATLKNDVRIIALDKPAQSTVIGGAAPPAPTQPDGRFSDLRGGCMIRIDILE